ncbi:hypothetical protein OSB04_015244 [Centaurea solstitialis]|uniref:Myosin-17-like n=1 Tax=Centaurea solstitialis TaxID=347529 RepID=A0AA38T089_9ASTR|nr:hypothetical protein OSB04_015244 [Centaurea solstitialis]
MLIMACQHSRFGKFVEIQFDKSGRISGQLFEPTCLRDPVFARYLILKEITTAFIFFVLHHLSRYLQEHAIIHLQDREKFKLESPQSYHYLNQSKSYELEGRSFQDAIFRVVAAILHLGNVEFAKGEEIDSSVLKNEKSRFHLNVTLSCLCRCDAKSLEDALIKRVMVTPEEIITRTLDPEAALGSTVLESSSLSMNSIQNADRWFALNSFEQFCINFTNEKLQQHFNQKPGGIISLLDEACMFPKSTHETFAQKLYQTFPKNKRFIKPKLSRTSFTIAHYAGELQLQSLMETLSTTEPHYIRCVKPNNVLKPAIFENLNIIQQLRCGGVLEAIRISCAGYPTRRTFDEFLLRFGVLYPDVLDGNYDEKVACQMLLDKMGLKGYQIGKTKVFLRAGQMAELDARRAEVLGNAAKIIQRQMRTYIARKEYFLLRRAAIQLQACWRALSACKQFEQLRREAAAVKIEKYFRCYVASKSYLTLRMSAITIQTGLRAMTARDEFRHRKQTKAAIFIQAHYRCYREYSYYKSLQKAAIVTQCGWRSRVARKELRELKMAARETGALKEAKDKLEKRVEELTWRLQLEKRQRTELEETKSQETAKLQDALRMMQIQIDEANAKVIKEREAARKAIEEAPPVVKETPVIVQDTEKVDTLTAEVESLKALLQNVKQEAEEAKKSLIEADARNAELMKKFEDAEKRADQLQESSQRLEEKLSNMESENQVLRQQALTMSPTGKSARPRTMIIQRTPENGNVQNGEARHTPETTHVLSNSREPDSEEKPQKSLNEKQQENQDLLIKCITQDLGFSSGKPVAACLIYKSLLHWRSFEVERTTVFDRIIQTIASAIEVQDSNDVLGYWLCNTSTLLTLLQHTLKASGAASMTPQRRRSSSASLFGRMSQGLRTPQSAGLSFLNGRVLGRLDDLRQVEAKYPALLFKQQLTAFLEKIYGMIRDNLKKEISPLLGLCIQAPRTSRASLVKGRSQANAVAQQALIAHWQSIVRSLDNYLKTMKANYVPPFLVRKVFTQIFSFINVQLFNSLLLRRECCSFSNGEYVKSGLAELEQWCCYATEEYAGSAWDELKHIRQAVGFLVIHQKPKKTLNEITNELCPVLSIQQLYRISTMYWDDKYGTHSVSSEVISNMRVMMTEDSNNSVSSSFLLDDDSSIPFSVDDISKSMPQVEVGEIEPPPLIRENSGFVFLHQRTE